MSIVKFHITDVIGTIKNAVLLNNREVHISCIGLIWSIILKTTHIKDGKTTVIAFIIEEGAILVHYKEHWDFISYLEANRHV